VLNPNDVKSAVATLANWSATSPTPTPTWTPSPTSPRRPAHLPAGPQQDRTRRTANRVCNSACRRTVEPWAHQRSGSWRSCRVTADG